MRKFNTTKICTLTVASLHQTTLVFIQSKLHRPVTHMKQRLTDSNTLLLYVIIVKYTVYLSE